MSDTHRNIKVLKVVERTRIAIMPFSESPAVNNCYSKIKDKKSMNAVELFSLFTADIIREEVLFLR